MNYQLEVEVLQYWHCGAGRGGGAVVDAKVQRDALGVPYIPGRHLRGLLRAACECAEQWQWQGCANLAAELFGERTESTKSAVPKPGCLHVGDGILPAAEANWLARSADGQKRLPALFHNLHATKIDPQSGSAEDRSLRGIEVTVPLTLHAELALLDGSESPSDWAARLRRVLPLVTAIGAHRSRGLGRAHLTLEEA